MSSFYSKMLKTWSRVTLIRLMLLENDSGLWKPFYLRTFFKNGISSLDVSISLKLGLLILFKCLNIDDNLLNISMPLSCFPLHRLNYSFSRWWFAGGELGSCFRLGDILDGEADKFLEASSIPVMLVGGWLEVGGLPLPWKAPESVRAGFCTAMICPPLADRTCRATRKLNKK